MLNHCSGIHFLNYSEIRENSQHVATHEDCGCLQTSQQTAPELWKHKYLSLKLRETGFGTYRSAIYNK